MREDVNVQKDSRYQVLERLRKIIEKNESKFAYFQNRLKQVQFIDRPSHRMVDAAGGQASSYADQLGVLHNQLRELEQLYGGSVELRTPGEHDLRRIWYWTNEPALRKILHAKPIKFETYVNNWHRWLAGENMYPFSIDLSADVLIGFLLIRCTGRAWETRHASLEFIVLRSDCRYRGYGKDAMKCAMDFAFEQLDVNTFGLQVDVDNNAAFLCFEKSGLQCIDREHYTNSDRYSMEIHREVWESANSSPAPLTQKYENDLVSAESSPYLTAKLLVSLKDLISDQTDPKIGE